MGRIYKHCWHGFAVIEVTVGRLVETASGLAAGALLQRNRPERRRRRGKPEVT